MEKDNFLLTGVIVMVINLLITGAMFCGGVYFVLWALKHFGIIGG